MQNSFYIFYVTQVTSSWQCKGILLSRQPMRNTLAFKNTNEIQIKTRSKINNTISTILAA